jgi:type II secretory pathway pseudopilin PulG
LIELCVVLIIVGLLTAAFFNYLNVTIKQKQQEDLRTNITDINTAITAFAKRNGGRLPCPAPDNIGPDDPAFGHETNCAGAATGTTVVNGRREGGTALKVRIGSLPTRDLNISDLAMLDPFGRRYSYAVTQALADNAGSDPSEGAIDVTDEKGNSILSSPGIARYVVFSHGLDGAGAVSLEGKSYKACATTSVDGGNCDNKDATFVATTVASTAANQSHYDDYLYYATVPPAPPLGGCPLYRAESGNAYQYFLTGGTRTISVPSGSHNQCNATKTVTPTPESFPAGYRFEIRFPSVAAAPKTASYGAIVDPADFKAICSWSEGAKGSCAQGTELPVMTKGQVSLTYTHSGNFAAGGCVYPGPPSATACSMVGIPFTEYAGVALMCGLDGQWHVEDNVIYQVPACVQTPGGDGAI